MLRYPMSTKTPNTFIVGAPKSGTSAMAAYLSEHPNVFLSNPKEPFYWCEDYERLRRRNEMTSFESYLALFQNASADHQVILEGSTNYLASKVAVEKIVQYEPEAKFVVMLRNPVEVVHAFHSEIVFAGIETEEDFETAWNLQFARQSQPHLVGERCEAPQFLQYAQVANYPEQLQRLFEQVPERNRKVVLYDDFRSDNRRCFDELLRFLELPGYHKDDFARVNASHEHRFKSLSSFILKPPAVAKPFVDATRSLARRYRGGLIDDIKMMLRKPSQRKPLCASFRARLLDFFQGQIRETGQMLNQDTSTWLKPM